MGCFVIQGFPRAVVEFSHDLIYVLSVMFSKLLPLVKYCLIKPLVFSFRPRSLSLTEIGHEIFEKALEILKSVDETKNMAEQNQGEPRGILKLTCCVWLD
jgi:hypothetical protein